MSDAFVSTPWITRPLERGREPRRRGGVRVAGRDDLRQQGVEAGRYRAPLDDSGIDPQPVLPRARGSGRRRPGLGANPFRGDSATTRASNAAPRGASGFETPPPGKPDPAASPASGPAADLQLRIHQIHSVDLLGSPGCSTWSRGVHLQEVEGSVRFEQELDRPGAPVAGRDHQPQRGFPHPGPQVGRDPESRRPFEELLAAALDGTLALAEVDARSAVPSPRTWTST